MRWPVVLDHGPIRLRPLRRRDGAEWDRVRRANEDWLRPWEPTRPPGEHERPPTWSAMVGMFSQQARQGRALPWLLTYDRNHPDRPPDHVLVGQVTVSGITLGSAGWGQIGYWIDRRWAGRGIVPTAVAMAVDHCFDVVGLHRIEVAIRPENSKSLRVVEKLGLPMEGVRRSYLHIDGAWRDHAVFVINREDVPDGLLQRWEQSRARDATDA